MYRNVGLIFLLVFASAVLARDSNAVFELIKKGQQLSQADASKLESEVEAKPRDEEARIKLLAYYATQSGAANAGAVKAARLKHVLWIIDKDPKELLGLHQVHTGILRINCHGDPLADRDGFESVAHLWNEKVAARREEAVHSNAVDALSYCAPEEAEKLLLADHDGSGLGRLYASAILGIAGQDYVTGDENGSDPTLRESSFAQAARRKLEQSSDKAMLVTGASALMITGAELWADGKLDWDYTPFGKGLLARARQMDPDNFMLITVPMELPKRGERPPPTVRVGGGTQNASLVRKVAPRYPEAAKARRISGIVRFSALIGLDGSILKLLLVSGPPELVEASRDAVRQWQYRPTMLNGKPCYVVTVIDVNYDIR
jgi:hypothetical protein